MYKLKLPDLTISSSTVQSYIIGGREYVFAFVWCDEFCAIDIYLIKNNERIYLVKGRPLSVDTDITSRVKDRTLITGSLYFAHKYNEPTEATLENFHTDFEMVYYDEIA